MITEGCLKRLGLHYNDFGRICSEVITPSQYLTPHPLPT